MIIKFCKKNLKSVFHTTHFAHFALFVFYPGDFKKKKKKKNREIGKFQSNFMNMRLRSQLDLFLKRMFRFQFCPSKQRYGHNIKIFENGSSYVSSYSCYQSLTTKCYLYVMPFNIWNKAFKNASSETYQKQPLQNLKWNKNNFLKTVLHKFYLA